MLIDSLPSAELTDGVRLTVLRAADADALADAYRRNRDHLAPWEPLRGEGFFTAEGQHSAIAAKLALLDAGTEVPWVIRQEDRIIGTITLTGIVRGPFLSANLGYWVDGGCTGGGIGTSAAAAVVGIARDRLGLHRVQAATLVHNTASQRILRRLGFDRIGRAPQYLKIAGRWQDHELYQRILQEPQ